MIYDVNSPLFRSFLSQKRGSSDKRNRNTEQQTPRDNKPKANENEPAMIKEANEPFANEPENHLDRLPNTLIPNLFVSVDVLELLTIGNRRLYNLFSKDVGFIDHYNQRPEALPWFFVYDSESMGFSCIIAFRAKDAKQMRRRIYGRHFWILEDVCNSKLLFKNPYDRKEDMAVVDFFGDERRIKVPENFSQHDFFGTSSYDIRSPMKRYRLVLTDAGKFIKYARVVDDVVPVLVLFQLCDVETGLWQNFKMIQAQNDETEVDQSANLYVFFRIGIDPALCTLFYLRGKPSYKLISFKDLNLDVQHSVLSYEFSESFAVLLKERQAEELYEIEVYIRNSNGTRYDFKGVFLHDVNETNISPRAPLIVKQINGIVYISMRGIDRGRHNKLVRVVWEYYLAEDRFDRHSLFSEVELFDNGSNAFFSSGLHITMPIQDDEKKKVKLEATVGAVNIKYISHFVNVLTGSNASYHVLLRTPIFRGDGEDRERRGFAGDLRFVTAGWPSPVFVPKNVSSSPDSPDSPDYAKRREANQSDASLARILGLSSLRNLSEPKHKLKPSLLQTPSSDLFLTEMEEPELKPVPYRPRFSLDESPSPPSINYSLLYPEEPELTLLPSPVPKDDSSKHEEDESSSQDSTLSEKFGLKKNVLAGSNASSDVLLRNRNTEQQTPRDNKPKANENEPAMFKEDRERRGFAKNVSSSPDSPDSPDYAKRREANQSDASLTPLWRVFLRNLSEPKHKLKPSLLQTPSSDLFLTEMEEPELKPVPYRPRFSLDESPSPPSINYSLLYPEEPELTLLPSPVPKDDSSKHEEDESSSQDSTLSEKFGLKKNVLAGSNASSDVLLSGDGEGSGSGFAAATGGDELEVALRLSMEDERVRRKQALKKDADDSLKHEGESSSQCATVSKKFGASASQLMDDENTLLQQALAMSLVDADAADDQEDLALGFIED